MTHQAGRRNALKTLFQGSMVMMAGSLANGCAKNHGDPEPQWDLLEVQNMCLVLDGDSVNVYADARDGNRRRWFNMEADRGIAVPGSYDINTQFDFGTLRGGTVASSFGHPLAPLNPNLNIPLWPVQTTVKMKAASQINHCLVDAPNVPTGQSPRYGGLQNTDAVVRLAVTDPYLNQNINDVLNAFGSIKNQPFVINLQSSPGAFRSGPIALGTDGLYRPYFDTSLVVSPCARQAAPTGP